MKNSRLPARMVRFWLSCAALGLLVWGAMPMPTAPVSAQSNVPPVISKVNISNIGATSSIIRWTTDKPANSYVNFGIAKNLGIARDPDPTVTEHEVMLSDLEPATTYFFRAMSADVSGNQVFSGTYQFTTKGTARIKSIEQIKDQEQKQLVQKAVETITQIKERTALEIVQSEVQNQGQGELQPPRIIGDPSLEIGADQVAVRWTTDREANGVVEFGEDASYKASNSYDRKEGDADIMDTKHEIILHGLKQMTTYHYKITSRSAVGPTGETDDKTFTTKSILPQIFGMRMQKVEEDSATVTWSTQVPAGGLVEYTNLNTKEGKSIGDPTMSLTHTIRLPDLKFKSPYRVLVKARTQGGDEITAEPITFVTTKDEEPPIIGQVGNESTLYPGSDAKVQTIISWDTDEPSRCQLFYSDNIAAKEEEAKTLDEETNPLQKHVQVITEFTPSTAYKFWVRCRDRNDNYARSEDFVLYTPEKEKSIIDIIIENFSSAFGWVKNIGK